MKTAVLAALGVLIAGSAAAGDVCESSVRAALATYGIAADRVTSTSVYARYIGGGEDDEGVHIGYRVWMRMKGCDKGYLVVDTDFVCNVEQTFTDGPCKIAGVPDC